MSEHHPGPKRNGMSRGGFLRHLALLAAGFGAGVEPVSRLLGLRAARPAAKPSGDPSLARPNWPAPPSISVKRRA